MYGGTKTYEDQLIRDKNYNIETQNHNYFCRTTSRDIILI